MQSKIHAIVVAADVKPKGLFATIRDEIKAAHPQLKGNALSIMVRDEVAKVSQQQNEAAVVGVQRLIREGYTFDRGTQTKTGIINMRWKPKINIKEKGDKLPTVDQVKAFLATLSEDDRFKLQEEVERAELATVPAIEGEAEIVKQNAE